MFSVYIYSIWLSLYEAIDIEIRNAQWKTSINEFKASFFVSILMAQLFPLHSQLRGSSSPASNAQDPVLCQQNRFILL